MKTNELKEVNRIVNRHKVRILTNLEKADCPQIFIDAVKAEINWLRTDLNDIDRNEGPQNEQGNQAQEPI